MGKSNAKERYQFWEEIMHQYEKSGLTRKEFCEKNNLSFSKFRNWRFRIRQSHKANKKRLSVDNDFIPLVVKDKPVVNKEIASDSIEVKLEASGNISICIPSSFNPEALSDLFNILRKTGC